ncbi:Fe(3+) ABC transporter substrate-binding protein [Chelativorans sp. SCAU2101]|jgi:iron(III) transport system substrate-binding protein|uniref:Fe(3+) ABC transporter substrate-binding protein n=1 Tax=Chelativorans petroleitrophicus TaxID=2975484 RepID=A0A9X2X920_9HYPH|nr:Fe(3+) ABC transporter substrate-binding protein [Chelativorans petroleitrophicus]MCT8989912.1 Fe(3+) ABC transporter substrate-binding protein [Chelativorans petroleitrophicus]
MFAGNFRLKAGLAALSLTAAALALPSAAQADGVVNIYSQRQPFLIEPLLEAFTEKTGIQTEVLHLNEGLPERIAAEGQNSPADVILTVDIGRLAAVVDAGVTQPVEDEVINNAIPAQYRDPEGHWFGLTTRARVVYASKDRVEQDTITYEELADPKWKGKICVRSGQHQYNIALFASLIAHHGEEATEEWMKGLKANLARKPAGGDRDQAQAIAAGECDIALGNTYYVGLMMNNEEEPEQKEWAAAIKVLFPNSEDRGTHVNISGMALAKHAPNKENALKLMQFLVSPEAQEIYAERNYEYPVLPGAEISETVKSFGELKPDTLPLSEIAKNSDAASEMVDRVGLDDGPAS